MSRGESGRLTDASDELQVEEAEREARERRRAEMADLRAVARTPEGKRVLYRLLDHCGAWRSIWHPSAAIHYRAGEQDVGHWLMGEIGGADKEALAALVVMAYAEQEEEEADGEE